jgi:hypothetical protein
VIEHETFAFLVPPECPLCSTRASMEILGVAAGFKVVLRCTSCEGALVIIMITKFRASHNQWRR